MALTKVMVGWDEEWGISASEYLCQKRQDVPQSLETLGQSLKARAETNPHGDVDQEALGLFFCTSTFSPVKTLLQKCLMLLFKQDLKIV